FDSGVLARALPHTNVYADNNGVLYALGNGTFSVPPLIEAADTGPFFHNNSAGPQIEDAVNFYGGFFFGISPAVQALDQRFGAPLEVLNADQAIKIARFLRVLNAAFNASLTIQRLEAVKTLIG